MTYFVNNPAQPDYSDEWYTPSTETDLILQALGRQEFDLDPCSPASGPTVSATRHYTSADDGLVQPWSGVVWLNPPYRAKAEFMARAVQEVCDGRVEAVIALLPANTAAIWFHDLVVGWPMWLRRGKVDFIGPRPGARNPTGSVLVAITLDDALGVRLQAGLLGSRWRRVG